MKLKPCSNCRLLRCALRLSIRDAFDAEFADGADGLRGEMREYEADLLKRAKERRAPARKRGRKG